MDSNYNPNVGSVESAKAQNEEKPGGTTRMKKITIKGFFVVLMLLGTMNFLFAIKCFVEVIMENTKTISQDTTDTTYFAKGYNFSVTADGSWEEKPGGGAFELELYNDEKDIYFHVMAYKKIDISDDYK